MADVRLDETAEARFDFISGGAAYTTPALPFRPDFWEVINLTANTDNNTLRSYGYRDMTAAHAFTQERTHNDGASDSRSLQRITANGFTLNTTAASVTQFRGTITGATAANPVVITDAAHGLATGDYIRITDVAGMIELNNRRYRINVLTVNTFELQDPETRVNINGTAYTAYTSGGRWHLLNLEDADRTVLDAAVYTLTLGTSVVGADNDSMILIVKKFGQLSELGDIG